MVWLILNAIFQFTTDNNNNNNNDNNDGEEGSGVGSIVGALLALTIPSVLIQCVVRMQFVKLYFSVEDVIRKSVAKHEAETTSSMDNDDDNNNNNDSNNGNTGGGGEQHAETNALQLQLNDHSCSLASGTGYALLHTLFLFGTLLASESHEGSNYYGNYSGGYYGGGGGSTGHGGTLYQYSCGGVMPSLVNGALVGMMFSVLDVFWMMLTFFGMRRRRRPCMTTTTRGGRGGRMGRIMSCIWDGLSFWKGMDDTPQGGNAALGLVVISHLLASLVLAPNGTMEDGCKISLPLLGCVVILVAMLFSFGVKGHFLPMDQRARIQELRLGGGGGGGNSASSFHVD